MPFGKGYTIEDQLTGEAKLCGTQFDIFDRLDSAVSFVNNTGATFFDADLFKTPAELDLEGELNMESR